MFFSSRWTLSAFRVQALFRFLVQIPKLKQQQECVKEYVE